MAAKFDICISENYGYVDSFEKVERIIRDHELDTTTKYALFKAPKDFGRRGKATKAEEGHQTSDFGLRTSDFRLPTSDFRLENVIDMPTQTSLCGLRRSDA